MMSNECPKTKHVILVVTEYGKAKGLEVQKCTTQQETTNFSIFF